MSLEVDTSQGGVTGETDIFCLLIIRAGKTMTFFEIWKLLPVFKDRLKSSRHLRQIQNLLTVSRIDRFGEIADHLLIGLCFFLVFPKKRRGDHNYMDFFRIRPVLTGFKKFPAIHIWHIEVQQHQNQIGFSRNRIQIIYCLPAIPTQYWCYADQPFQAEFLESGHYQVIFGNEYVDFFISQLRYLQSF